MNAPCADGAVPPNPTAQPVTLASGLGDEMYSRPAPSVHDVDFAGLDVLYRQALRALAAARKAGHLQQYELDYLQNAFMHTPHPMAFQALCLDVIGQFVKKSPKEA